ncbi:N-acetylgalactosamine-6-sulfatase [Hyunsoonleella flava]|uniref:N-acetylgalactosamine-6-sulfatase n=1 Tax=Hyunsoonleella flava TaxID=2527939 RepID=A0A4Q9FHE8_9FLAO|nr:sulfatase [Hyunsoonleella flava]TBN06331.1 N-acetylgalactosamine-6-sulfatase [Hyunsoonleella flava]
MNKFFGVITLTAVLFSCVSDKKIKTAKNTPNIVFIFTDDLGYGDLGCFGAEDIATPNIDGIAKAGIKFTDFYSASPICSPSRAGLMTGRMPQRMGINGVFFPDSYTGMSPSEITIAELLKTKGYKTGIVGKWHLGHREKYLPLQQGFDSYFGIPYSNDMTSVVYMRDNEVESYKVDQRYTTQTYTKEALGFIENNKEQPFFLYVAHNMPHVPIYASPEFEGKSKRGLYGDVIEEIDWSVGQIVNKLETSGLLDNTLIVFSSDNGPWLAMRDHGGSAGHLREGKQYTFEGGMRVPTVAMWKGKIKPNTVATEMASQMDWFPTFAKITGAEIPQETAIDGEDISKVLFNTGKRKSDDYLFFDNAKLEAYRRGDWKVKLPYKGYKGSRGKKAVAKHDTLLFNIKNDPGETNNLYETNKGLARTLIKEMYAKTGSLGELPPSLIIRGGRDDSHFRYLYDSLGK